MFHIVVADSRAKRDGRFIEALGIYNPNTNPATIDINFERALEWMMTGAEPSDTARAILSHKGILMKKHLLEGVKKGALTLEQVEERFEKWLNEKQALVDNKVTSLMSSAQKTKADRLKAETESNAKKAGAIAAKLALMSSAALETAVAAAAEPNETVEAPDLIHQIGERTGIGFGKGRSERTGHAVAAHERDVADLALADALVEFL